MRPLWHRTGFWSRSVVLSHHQSFNAVLIAGLALALSACGKGEGGGGSAGRDAPPPPIMGPGEQSFGFGGAATPFLDRGWSKQEPWGVWSEAAAPTLKGNLFDAACLNLKFKVQAHVVRARGPMTVQVKLGDTPAATWTFRDAVAKEVTVPCPPLGTAQGPISFVPSYVVSPKDAGESADARPLGIALVSVKLEQAPTGPLRGSQSGATFP